MMPAFKTLAILSSLILPEPGILFAQQKVAYYAIGKDETNKYEQFSFGINNGRRTELTYAYGVKEKQIKLKYLGPAVFEGKNCFKIEFPNKLVLFVIPDGLKLKVVDSIGKYKKIFPWQYQGPVDGRGTFCDVCAEDDKEAIAIVKDHYMK
jgi:hypothetical protein